MEFRNAGDHMLASKVEARTSIASLIGKMKHLNLSMKPVMIDLADFLRWRGEYSEFVSFYRHMGEASIEKQLEHYLTMKYLPVLSGDTVIDVAAASSPFVKILKEKMGISGYKLDQVYQPGLRNDEIGCDAGAIPVSDEFADVLTLHCAFECFQDPSDVLFASEAVRVLRPGGRLGIVPLYLDDVHFVKTGPRYDKRKVKVEADALWLWRDDKYEKEPFSRHYSPDSLKGRVIDHMNGLTCEIVHFSNLDEVRDRFPGQRIYCHFLLKAVKEFDLGVA